MAKKQAAPTPANGNGAAPIQVPRQQTPEEIAEFKRVQKMNLRMQSISTSLSYQERLDNDSKRDFTGTDLLTLADEVYTYLNKA